MGDGALFSWMQCSYASLYGSSVYSALFLFSCWSCDLQYWIVFVGIMTVLLVLLFDANACSRFEGKLAFMSLIVSSSFTSVYNQLEYLVPRHE